MEADLLEDIITTLLAVKNSAYQNVPCACYTYHTVQIRYPPQKAKQTVMVASFLFPDYSVFSDGRECQGYCRKMKLTVLTNNNLGLTPELFTNCFTKLGVNFENVCVSDNEFVFKILPLVYYTFHEKELENKIQAKFISVNPKVL